MAGKIAVKVAHQIDGFRYGNKQFQCRLNIDIENPRVFFTEESEKLLMSAFGISAKNSVVFDVASKNKMDGPIKGLIAAGSSIAQNLLEHGAFPSYEQAVVTDFYTGNEKPNRAGLGLLVATQQFQNNQMIRGAYLIGLQIAQAFTLPASYRVNLIAKSNDILDRFIKILEHTTHGGLSTRYILREAFNRGLPIIYRPEGQYQIGLGNKQRVFLRSATLQDSAVGSILTKDKHTCIQHLKAAGVPTPNSHRVNSANDAKLAAKKLGFPVVLKPSNLDRGEGVFVDIKTDEEIDIAFNEIQKLSKNIIIENRVPGMCHRLLVFRDEVVFAFARHPLSIVGDGETDIASLIHKGAETQKHRAVYLQKKPAKLDSQAIAMLHAQGFSADTVLKKDQIAHLRPFQSLITGGHDERLTNSVHPANAELARRAARLFGLEIAGIDLISTDITTPWYENNAVINEVNFQPQVRDNTARAILDGYFPDNNGDIPIECFIGDDAALSAALQRQTELCEQRENAFLTSHTLTTGPAQSEIPLFGLNTLFSRVEYLLRDSRVDTLIVVVQTNELASTGLPFYRISSLNIINQNLQAINAGNGKSTAAPGEEIIALCRAALERWVIREN